MSTRGCVAIKREDGWEGIYNHFDSYPTGLGADLWERLHEVDLSEFAENLLNYTAWRDYLNGGECKYCGKKGLGQPHSMRGKIMGFDSDVGSDPEPEIRRNIQLTGVPDPKAEYHEHELEGDTSVEDTHVTSENPDPLYIEWVYVIDPDKESLEILTNRGKADDIGEPVDEPWLRDDGYWEYGHCAYRHVRIALVNLDGLEPDWELIGKVDRAIAVPRGSSEPEEVSERLKYGSETKECPVCGNPVPEARKHSELEDRTVGHEECIREALEKWNANVNLCLLRPEDLEE